MGNRDISVEVVATKILLIRGKKVMLDRDLAQLCDEVVADCDHLKVLKFSYQMPYAFTEQGVAMLSQCLELKTCNPG